MQLGRFGVSEFWNRILTMLERPHGININMSTTQWNTKIAVTVKKAGTTSFWLRLRSIIWDRCLKVDNHVYFTSSPIFNLYWMYLILYIIIYSDNDYIDVLFEIVSITYVYISIYYIIQTRLATSRISIEQTSRWL